MEKLLVVTSAPHIKSSVTTQRIMLDVLIALVPALVASVWLFGPVVLLAVAISVISCVFFEWASQKVLRKDSTLYDLSAAITGVLIAFGLPASAPLWIYPIGALFAIVFTKQLFGGIGQNFANPAIVARIVLMISFVSLLTVYPTPTAWHNNKLDATTSSTPLAIMDTTSHATSSATTEQNKNTPLPSLFEMFIGKHAGAMGETSAIALFVGGIYLLIRKVISPVIPITFLSTTAIFAWFFGYDPLYTILSGGLMIGAIFMATDYSTSPSTTFGRILFGVGCGLFTALIRIFGSYPEGVSFAILIMNIITPLIDRFIKPKPFGGDYRCKIR